MPQTPTVVHPLPSSPARCFRCGVTAGRPHQTNCPIAECRRRGWFAVRAPEGQPGYVSCSKDTPGAIEDLNRWEVFRATGADVCYPGQAQETGDNTGSRHG